MAREPQRREQPAPLGAAIIPVERALIARAKNLEDQSRATDGGNVYYLFLAAEFRALAAELSHW